MAEEKREEPDQHQCFRNYEGTFAGREATAVVEAFKQSISMYGLKYTKFVADRDSKVYLL